jgi:hypothetical protein
MTQANVNMGANSFSLIESKTSAYSFYLLGSDGIRGLILDDNSQCGSVQSSIDVYLTETVTWSSHAKITSSVDFIWVANSGIITPAATTDPATQYTASARFQLLMKG